MLKLLLTILLLQTLSLNAQFPLNCPKDSECITPGGNAGRCVLFKDCEFDLDQALSGFSNHSWLSTYVRTIFSWTRLVCCPTLQSEPGCGSMMMQNHIFGGVETHPEEFPWTAMIHEIDPSNGEPIFICGGTLINKRFVVTAAHCVNDNEFVSYLIRLGAWNRSDHESSVADFYPETIFVHEKYSPKSKNSEHDIAVIKLDNDAPRTDFIEPICLPTQAEYKLELTMPFFVSGWGLLTTDELSEVKMKLKLPGRELSVCDKAYIATNFTENHLCVGGSSGKDSCKGDSGGPLMTEINAKAYLVGIVSFGPGACGIRVPAIYTRFDKYLSWVATTIEIAS